MRRSSWWVDGANFPSESKDRISYNFTGRIAATTVQWRDRRRLKSRPSIQSSQEVHHVDFLDQPDGARHSAGRTGGDGVGQAGRTPGSLAVSLSRGGSGDDRTSRDAPLADGGR